MKHHPTTEQFLTVLAYDFDFSHGGIDDKRKAVERLLRLADLKIVPRHTQSVRAMAVLLVVMSIGLLACSAQIAYDAGVVRQLCLQVGR